MSAVCPVCSSELTTSLYPSYAGLCITSDMKVLEGAKLDNRLCESCGLIFNAAGTRGFTERFYRNSYSLMMRSEQAAVQSFSGPAPISQAERTYQFLREMLTFRAEGTVLEAGAGKGEFLTLFAQGLPDWKLAAFEPSTAFDVLTKRLPQAEVQHCDYGAFSFPESAADLVVALGVLEHVENPLDMLRWANRRLVTGGHFYIRVPNFAANPNDLFCADHLSKLTVPNIRSLAAAAGFEVSAVKEGGVPVFALLRKAGPPVGDLRSVLEQNRGVAIDNQKVARALVESVLRARDGARSATENFGIFGLASAGLFAPFYGEFDVAEICAYIDENKTVWGSKVHGRPVVGPDRIGELGVKHIALAISPVYFEQVRTKLAPLDVKVYAA